MQKVNISILIGNIVDHFEMGLYSFLVPIMAPYFFSGNDPITALILGYGVMATSIISRPIGIIIFSQIAKKYNPIFAISHSLLWGALLTFSIGCLPGYETIGFFAPLLLVLLRTGGNIFSAGESCIAKIYLMQDQPKQNALKLSQYYETSTMLGIIFASMIATLAIYLDNWRFCFYFSALAGIVGYILRISSKQRSIVSVQESSIESQPICWLNIIQVILVSGFSYVTYAIPFILLNSFVPLVTNHNVITMMQFNNWFSILDCLLIPMLGKILNRFDIKSVMKIALLLFSFTVPLLFHFIPQSSLTYICLVRIWIIFLGIMFLCPMGVFIRERLGNNYLAIGLAQAFGTSALGRITPSICLLIYHQTHSPWMMGISMSVLSSIVFVAVSSKMKSQRSLEKNAAVIGLTHAQTRHSGA